MKKWACFFAIFLSLSGCYKNQEMALVQSSVPQRPIVAIAPVIDRSSHHLKWNLSDEMSQTFKQFFGKTNRLYLASEENFSGAGKYLAWADPFESDTSWYKKAFPTQEFVVFTEVLHHTEIPLSQGGPSELVLFFRVKVVDLRLKTPQTVLAEVIEQSHHIPHPFTIYAEASHQVAWKEGGYDLSPLGIAHATLAREIASRAEDYILGL
jgi:hypothetical protein